METLLQDLRYGFRTFLKSPGFAAAAVLTLALGIGANTAIFSLVNAVLLRQLPYKNPEKLIWVWSTRTDRDKAFYSIPNFIDTRDENQSLEQMAAFSNWGANLTNQGEPERIQGVRLSAHAFQMLGIEAALGRTLIAEDDRPQSPRVIVLSHGLWQRRFGGDREVIGKTLTLNGDAYAIVGVLPAYFKIPNAEIEIATPLRMEVEPRRSERGSNFLRVFARLKPGVTLEQARADLTTITARLREKYPDDNAKHTAPNLLPLHEEIVGGYRNSLLLLLAAVVLVLLIACANLAGLLLERATARHKEIAIRAALGASRRRLLRQMLTESLMLAITGGALGLLLATTGRDLLLSLSPADLPRLGEVSMDGRILLFCLSLSLLAGIIFGLVPAIRATKTDLNVELKEGGRSSSGITSSRIRGALVITEVTLSLVLLVGAGLLIKSLVKLQQVTPGFDVTNLLTVRLSLPLSKYSKPEAVKVFYDKLAARLIALPGVETAGAANVLPLSGMNVRTEFTISDRPPLSATDTPAAQNRWVSPAYFHSMRIPIVQGRDFTESDNEQGLRVIIIDELLMRRYWPNESPIGAHVQIGFGADKPSTYEIVGVVGNVKHTGLNEEPTATLYAPFYQMPQSVVSFFANSMSIVVRSATDARTLTEAVRRELQSVDSEVPATGIKTMEQFLADSLAQRSFNLFLLTAFALTALILALAGLYAIISYSITQRSREIGIRIALGAQAGDLVKSVIAQGMKLVLVGVGLGLIASLAFTRVLSSLLFGVSATDPLTLAVTTLLIIAIALPACYIPARRAAMIDPLIALRQE
jgi:predicted permease